jgi:hypothetical protein
VEFENRHDVVFTEIGCIIHKFFEVFFGIIPRHAGAHVKHEYEMRRTYLFYQFVVSYHEFRILRTESIFCIFEYGNFFVQDFIQLVYTILTFQIFVLIGSLLIFKLIQQFGESLIYLGMFFFAFFKLALGVFKVTFTICLFHHECLKQIFLFDFFFYFFIQLCFLT